MPDVSPTPAPRQQVGERRFVPGQARRHLAFLAVTGPLDSAGAVEFLELALSLHRPPCCLVVDLERCEGADVSGFRALLRLCDVIESAGGELRLSVPPHSRIHATLAFFGLRSRLQVYATLREACAGVAVDSPPPEPCRVLDIQETC